MPVEPVMGPFNRPVKRVPYSPVTGFQAVMGLLQARNGLLIALVRRASKGMVGQFHKKINLNFKSHLLWGPL